MIFLFFFKNINLSKCSRVMKMTNSENLEMKCCIENLSTKKDLLIIQKKPIIILLKYNFATVNNKLGN